MGSGGENSLTRLAYGGIQVLKSAMSARGRRRRDARRRGISLVGLKGICGAIEVSRLVQLFYRFEKGRELRREGGIA